VKHIILILATVILQVTSIDIYAMQSDSKDQTGSITGIIIDESNGEPLIGATVIIEETGQGDASDLDGRFTIKNVEPGIYTLKASFISHATVIIEEVEVKAGEVLKLDITLKPKTEVLEEVVVTARSILNNEASLLSERQKSLAFSDAVSAEFISQTGSGDAAAAVKRITGATVEDGKYVVIRGLGGRYTNSQLNGANLPTADPDRNSAQLDLFPSELISSVTTKKTFTPDQPGNFSGGNVDIRTKEFPDEAIFTITTGIGLNTQSSFNDNFLIGPSGSKDFLAFDDGLRELPSIVRDPDTQIPGSQFARRDASLAKQLNDISEAFSSTMIPSGGPLGGNQKSQLNNDFSFTYGDQETVFGNSLGFIVSGSYSRKFEFYDDGVNNQFNATDPNADELFPDFTFNDIKGTKNVNWGGMASLNYKLNQNHRVGFNYLRTQDASNTGRYQVGNFPKNIPSENVFFETFVLDYTERNVNSFQLKGKHYFKKLNNIQFDWNASLADTKQEQPDLRFFFDEFTNVSRGDSTFQVFSINLGSSNATLPTRLFRDLDENNNQLSADIEIPFQTGRNATIKLKTGFSFEDKDRTFRERKFDYNSVGINFRDFNGDVDAFFADEVVGIIDTTNSGLFVFGNVIQDASIRQNNYDGDQKVKAFYGMIELPITQSLKIVGGTRFEQTDILIVSQDSTRLPGEIDTNDILPSASIIYAAGSNMNFRLSASQTIARPTFREIAPFQAFDFAGGRITSGNPELDRSLIQNFDARWEWFMSPGEVIAVSGFYKNFDDPIERVILSNNNQESFQNVESANLFGVEFEFRKRLDFISNFFSDFLFSSNLTLIDSNVDVPERELEFAEGFDISDTRPLQGQSDFVVNSILSYQNSEIGLNTSMAYNRFGKRLTNVGLGGTPNIFEQGRNDLFLSISKNIMSTYKIKLSISNLLDDNFKTIQTFKGGTFTDSEFKLGRTFKLAFTYNL